jgi:hypothetical protein
MRNGSPVIPRLLPNATMTIPISLPHRQVDEATGCLSAPVAYPMDGQRRLGAGRLQGNVVTGDLHERWPRGHSRQPAEPGRFKICAGAGISSSFVT